MFGPKWKRGEWRVAGAGRVERIGCAGLGGAGRRVECCSNQNDTSTTTNASRTRRQAHSSVEIDDVLPTDANNHILITCMFNFEENAQGIDVSITC